MATSPELNDATANDLADVRALLEQANLPFEDLSPEAMQAFVVVRGIDSALIGAGGIEQYENNGLLRSVVVHESARGTGLGKRIATAVETRGRENGITDLYLLTTTAAEFFPRLGYEKFDRSKVPEKLQRSTEFAALCPASAACLHKRLG